MDTRQHPPALLNWTTVTPENFEANINLVEEALRLPQDSLKTALFTRINLDQLQRELTKSQFTTIDALDNTLINVTVTEDEDPETANLMETKRTELKAELNKLFDYLVNQKNVLITAQIEEVERTRLQIVGTENKGCHAGNHALTLNTFKRNLAIALQQAAHAIYLRHEASRKVPANFNHIFEDISHIDERGDIAHHTAIYDHYANCTLNELQSILSRILGECERREEQAISNEIKKQLNALNQRPGNEMTDHLVLLGIHHTNLHFTDNTHAIETHSLEAAQTAKQLLRQLAQHEDDKIDVFEEDNTVQTRAHELRKAIAEADEEIEICRENVAERLANMNAPQGDSPPIATLSTIAAEPTPSKQGFWQRHPVFKKACIGALIGLGVVAVAAAVAGILFLTVGAAAAPIGAFFGMMVAHFGIAGTVGFGCLAGLTVTGIGASIGALIGGVQARKPKAANAAAPSTTAGLLKDMSSNDLPASALKATPAPLPTGSPAHQPSSLSPTRPSKHVTFADDQPITLGLRK